MEKIIGEDDIKGLEEEIDSAVDRLFVEKKKSATEGLSMEPSPSEHTHEPVKASDLQSRIQSTPEPLPIRSTPEPLPLIKSFEKMETQLLSLEWEITKENLERTREEVLVLREILKERTDITSVLNLMEKALIHMITNEENIQPQQIKFLLDSKETIKLLLKKETEGEIHIYKQLAFGGIKARFLCLEGWKETGAKQPSSDVNEESDKTEMPKMWGKQVEGMLNKMQSFLEAMDGILKKFEQHLSSHGQMVRVSSEKLWEKKSIPVEITVFKIDEKLFGIESNKVFKLFKAPSSFQEKYSSQQKIRLKDFEMKVVDLKKLFSIEHKDPKGEIQILIAKEDGEYIGLMVDQILKRLSARAEVNGEYAEYLLGMVHWTYQEQPVDIPILNLKTIQ